MVASSRRRLPPYSRSLRRAHSAPAFSQHAKGKPALGRIDESRQRRNKSERITESQQRRLSLRRAERRQRAEVEAEEKSFEVRHRQCLHRLAKGYNPPQAPTPAGRKEKPQPPPKADFPESGKFEPFLVPSLLNICLLYTSDAADERSSVD